MNTGGQIISYSFAVFLAVLLHLGVVGLLLANWSEATGLVVDTQPYYIEARVLTDNPFQSRADRERQRQQAALDRLQRQRQATDASLKEQQAAWERERQRLEELQKQAALQAQVEQSLAETAAEPDPARQNGIQQSRADLAESLARAVAREQSYRKAVTDDEKAQAYVWQIKSDIVANWSRPPSARNGMQALLRVRLIPTGEVIDVKLEESSGNDAFDRSAVLAVNKARQFTVPEDSRSFEQYFREFTVLFRPEDLRL